MKYDVVVLLSVLLLLGACTGNAATGAMSTDPSLQQQVVRVGLNAQGYTFSPSTVKANQPVKLVRDPSLQGCAMFIISPELGINANLMANEEYVFVPKKTGTFDVMCSMNMFRGRLSVQ